MKLHNVLTIASATLALATTDADLEKECGRLGVMKIDLSELPEGVDPSEIRNCADHPLGWTNFWGYGDYLPAWLPF